MFCREMLSLWASALEKKWYKLIRSYKHKSMTDRIRASEPNPPRKKQKKGNKEPPEAGWWPSPHGTFAFL
jgi:hypothetical protein